MWTLEEFGYSYDLIRLDPFKGETKTQEFLSLNASAKIPVLIHGNEILTESLAIMEYLNDLSDKKKLIPCEIKNNLKYRTALHYGLTEIEPYVWLAEQSSRLKSLYNWSEGTFEEALVQVKNNIPTVWKLLGENKYIAGNEFTLADIYFYHLITWCHQHGIVYPSKVDKYLKRLQIRAAFPAEM